MMNDAVADAPRVGRRITRRMVALAGLVLFVLVLLGDLASLLRASAAVLPHPYEFDYGEGIVWQQMRNLLQGFAYGPLGVFPAIVYHYPPVYHLTAAAVAHGLGLDELMAGRLVSLLSALISALLVGRLTFDAIGRDGTARTRLVCAVLAGLVLLSCRPVLHWAPLMRVDLLACAFSLAGLVLAIRALDRPATIYAASLAFALALYTKQTSIAAPAAAFIALLLVRPQLAWRGIAATAAMGAITLAGLWLATEGGFVRHTVLYNVNRLDPARIVLLLQLLASHGLYVVAALIGLVSVLPRLRVMRVCWVEANRGSLALLIAAAYLALKTIMLPMIMKSGAAENHFTEWCCALAVFFGLGLHPVIVFALGGRAPGSAKRTSWLLALLLVGMPLQAFLIPRWDVTPAEAAAQARSVAPLVAMIRESEKPVVSDEMTLPIRAGRAVLWEAAITAELAHSGLYDEPAFVEKIRRREFGFFATRGRRGDALFDERYNAPVAAAIDEAYPIKRDIGGMTVHLPAR